MTTGLLIRDGLKRPILGAAPTSYATPALIDLRAQLLESSDQGDSSHCAAFALAGCLEYHNWKRYGTTAQIDPYPIYSRAKVIDDLPREVGTTLEAVVQAAEDLGLLSWLDNAKIRTVTSAFEVKQALHRSGVLLAGFNITENWAAASADGWIARGGQPVGGHAVCLCGYDQSSERPYFAFQGSWGAQGWRGFNRIEPDLFREQFIYALSFEA